MILLSALKSGEVSDLWQQLELLSELGSDLRDVIGFSVEWLVAFNIGKSQLVSFDWSNNSGAMDVNMDGSVFEEIIF